MVAGDYSGDEKVDDEEEKRLMRLGIIKHDNKYRKDVKLSHFWGPLINDKDEVVKKRCRFIVANEKWLILDPTDNPFWHEKPPYVWASPLKVLFRHVGKGLTEDVRGIEDAVVSFGNLQMDNLLWRMAGIREVDELAIEDDGKSDLMELYPGKFFRRRSGYQGDAFKYHELGFDPDSAMPMLKELMLFHESDHGVDSHVETLGSTDETATAYKGRRASGMSDFQSIAKDIENCFMVDNLDMARDLMIQFLSDFNGNAKLSEVFEEEGFELDSMNDEERQAMIITDQDFIARGISIFFDRMEKIEKIGSMVKMLNAFPEEAQDYIPYQQLAKSTFEAFAFDDVQVRTEDEVAQIRKGRQEAAEQERMMLIAQFMGELQKERIKIDGKLQEVKMRTDHDARENDKDRTLKVAEGVKDSIEKDKDRRLDAGKEVLKNATANKARSNK